MAKPPQGDIILILAVMTPGASLGLGADRVNKWNL
jgi:hypothetical protein